MFHLLYGWMAGFILSFKVFLGQKLDKFSEKSNLYQRNICCPPRLRPICTYIKGTGVRSRDENFPGVYRMKS